MHLVTNCFGLLMLLFKQFPFGRDAHRAASTPKLIGPPELRVEANVAKRLLGDHHQHRRRRSDHRHHASAILSDPVCERSVPRLAENRDA